LLTGLILAAGSSKRLGRPKQLLPYLGTTLLGWTIAQAEASRALDEVLVVVGHAHEQIVPSLSLSRSRIVYNAEFTEGCAASYRTGLAAANPHAEGVMIVLSDQPGIEAEVIDLVAAAWRASRAGIVVSSYLGRLGHPLVFGRQFFPDLAALHGDKAAWKLLDRHPDMLETVDMGRPLPPDVDTAEDAALLR
jgi:molybdenum cofactor cytidylyltransferase